MLACMVGYAWLARSLMVNNPRHMPEVCVIKKVSSIPCPSCGTTRSMMLLSKGELNEAFLMNPFGYILAVIMLALPLWILVDVLRRRESFFRVYRRAEAFIARPQNIAILVLLVASNWIWNIMKGL